MRQKREIMRGILLGGVFLAAGLCADPALAKSGKARTPKAEIVVKGVKDRTKCKLIEQAKQILAGELKKAGLPTVKADAPAQKGITRYGLVLHITTCSHQLLPPAKGRAYKRLAVDVGAALDAEKMPSGQLARAGAGQATVATEVTGIKPKELAQLRKEALEVSTQKAIAQFAKSLIAKKTKRKRRRRRRRR
jgi:hypothetical protein